MEKKIRLDSLLVERNLFNSRSAAQNFIRAGMVFVEGQVVDKPGKLIKHDAAVQIKEVPRYVSRGGIKLAGAIGFYNIDIKNKVCLDIGASTGGFTDCLLQYGAKRVYAVDVGYGQLAYKLRTDPRVVVMEKINARYLKRDNFPERIELVTIDVSFISLEKIIPAVADILEMGGECIALIKPQFEAVRKEVKKGVVRDPRIHKRVVERIKKCFIEYNLSPAGEIYPSPVTGPKGNKEFFIYARRRL